jgi:hypothetical protein
MFYNWYDYDLTALIAGSPDHIEVGKGLLYSPVHGPAKRKQD